LAHKTRILNLRLLSVLAVILVAFTSTGISFADTQLGTWSSNPSPTTAYILRSLSMVSEKDGWAVGMKTAPNGNADGGVLLRWDGASWQVYNTPGYALFGVVMLSSTDGWAVGQNYSSGPLAVHWNGSGWLPVDVPNCNMRLNAVAMASTSKAWAVGPDCIATWNGSNWTTISLNPASRESLDTVTMVSEHEAWAIGPNALAHLTYAGWNLTHPVLTDRYYSLSTVAADDIWGAGNINGEILHYDGVNWSVFTTISGHHEFFGIKMISASDGWAVGDIIAHWDGTSWTQVAGPYNSYLWSVDFKGLSGWAVGYDGSILHYAVDLPYKVYLPSLVS
jgi:hypothetical protein